MAKKRKDQRFVLGEDTENQIFSLIPKEAKALVEAREAFEKQLAIAKDALHAAPTDLLADSLAKSTGRRGGATFEIDPDGKMVMVVSYGGEACDPLTRSTLKPAWTKRNERKPRKPKVETPEPQPTLEVVETIPDIKPEPPKKRGGFIKTSVAVSETKVIDLDDILDGFDDDSVEEEIAAQVDEVVYENAYVPDKRKKKLRRIPNQKVKRGSVGSTSLSDLAKQAIEKGDDQQ